MSKIEPKYIKYTFLLSLSYCFFSMLKMKGYCFGKYMNKYLKKKEYKNQSTQTENMEVKDTETQTQTQTQTQTETQTQTQTSTKCVEFSQQADLDKEGYIDVSENYFSYFGKMLR